MALTDKKYSEDAGTYNQSSVSARIEALFLNNVGLVLTGEQIARVAKVPGTGADRENWHQRLSELRTDKGYTILSQRDTKDLKAGEYLMPHTERTETASKRVLPTQDCWKQVLTRAGNCCEWREDGQLCGLAEGSQDPVGGGTVKLTADHMTPHSINPNTDRADPTQWQALCGRHQVMKKNYWDSGTGKINVTGVLQSLGKDQKTEALHFLLTYFGHEIKSD